MPWSPLPTPDGDGGPGPSKLDALLGTVLDGLGGPSVETIVVVHERWAEVVGEEVAVFAEPVGIEDRTLRIRVRNAAWASHLRWAEADIVRRLDALVGAGTVTAISVRVTRR